MKISSRLLTAILLVFATVVFAIGVTAEGDHNEAGSSVAAATEAPGAHNEAAEHAETATAAGASHADEGTFFGIDAESPGVIAAVVAISLALAAAAVFVRSRGVLVVVVLFALAFAALDLRELLRHADASNTGIVLAAGLAGLLHLGAAGTAAREVRK